MAIFGRGDTDASQWLLGRINSVCKVLNRFCQKQYQHYWNEKSDNSIEALNHDHYLVWEKSSECQSWLWGSRGGELSLQVRANSIKVLVREKRRRWIRRVGREKQIKLVHALGGAHQHFFLSISGSNWIFNNLTGVCSCRVVKTCWGEKQQVLNSESTRKGRRSPSDRSRSCTYCSGSLCD